MQNNNIKILTIKRESEIDILKGKISIYWDLVIKYDKKVQNTIDLLKRNFKDRENLYLIAKDWNKFVWFCSIDKEWWEDWFFFIREIFIEPKYQKQSLWNELMQRSIHYAKDKWAIWVVTQTDFKNIPMQKLCDKLWFIKWDNTQWKEWITYKLIFNNETIDEILLKKLTFNAWIKSIKSIQKIEVWFSNYVYDIDNKYILKISRAETKEDEKMFEKDIYFCNLFHDKIPTPKIIYSDTSKKIHDQSYFIYNKIHWENLYNKWHNYNESQRKSIIEQICNIIRIINNTQFEDYAKQFNIDIKQSWKDRFNSRIESELKKVLENEYLKSETIKQINNFIDNNLSLLKEEKIALTYYDLHFDNFLVKDDKIVWILDFERVDLLSIDYALDLIRRMAKYPKKYASEEAEKLVVPKDYSNLMNLYKKFYSELFDFKDVDIRLDLYWIEYSLWMIHLFPEAQQPKDELLWYLDNN